MPADVELPLRLLAHSLVLSRRWAARAMACPETGEVSTTNAIPSTAKVMIAAFSVATEEARTAFTPGPVARPWPVEDGGQQPYGEQEAENPTAIPPAVVGRISAYLDRQGFLQVFAGPSRGIAVPSTPPAATAAVQAAAAAAGRPSTAQVLAFGCGVRGGAGEVRPAVEAAIAQGQEVGVGDCRF